MLSDLMSNHFTYLHRIALYCIILYSIVLMNTLFADYIILRRYVMSYINNLNNKFTEKVEYGVKLLQKDKVKDKI